MKAKKDKVKSALHKGKMTNLKIPCALVTFVFGNAR